MISDDVFNIRLLKKPHKFFVYWIGRPDYHIMDWLGCNFHWVRAGEQPKGGFDNPWDAWMWADKRIVLQKQEVYDELALKSGTHLNEYKDYFESNLHYYPDGKRQYFSVHCPLYCDKHDQVFVDPPDEWWQEYDKWIKQRMIIWSKERARKMRRQGYSIASIAITLGRPTPIISKWIKEDEQK